MDNSATKARVLVVDDSDDLQLFYRMALETAGYTVAVASNGLEALASIGALRPDVIVTDVSMPVMDGLQFLERLRSDVAPPLPPVIVCSGFDEAKNDAIRLGALRFVMKPVDPTALLSLVDVITRGEAADATSATREQKFVESARSRATDAAQRLLAGVDPDAPQLVDAATRFAEQVSGYFGGLWTEVLLVDKGPLRTLGRSRRCPAHQYSGEAFYSSRVLASGASLVLPDAARSFTSVRAAAQGIGFFVGVPLLHEGVPIGALCVMETRARGFSAEDLLILETLGRSAASALPGIVRERAVADELLRNIGLTSPSVFDAMLEAELRLLHRSRGALDLLVAELMPGARDEAALLAAIVRAAKAPERMAATLRGNELVMFKRAAAPEESSRSISELLRAVRASFTIRAHGWVSVVDDGMPAIRPQTLLQLGAGALEETARAPRGVPVHVTLRLER